MFSIESLATWTDQYCGEARTASFFKSDYTAFPDALMDITKVGEDAFVLQIGY